MKGFASILKLNPNLEPIAQGYFAVSTPSFRDAADSLKARIGEGGAGRAADVLDWMLAAGATVVGKSETKSSREVQI